MPLQKQEARIVLSAEDRFSQTMAGFRRQVQQSNDYIKGLGSGISSLGFTLGTLGAGFSTASVLGFIRTMANDIDALNDAADAVGDSIERISALDNLARQNGASLDLVVDSLQKMNFALAEAKEDSPQARALRAIGLSAAELRSQAPTEALRSIAKALNEYADDGNKARIIQELLGRNLREIAPLLKDIAESGEINATVTRAQAEEAERFNKALARLAADVKDAAREIAGPLVSSFNEAIARMRDMREVFGSFRSGVGSLITGPFSISDEDLEKQRKVRAEVHELEETIARIEARRERQGGRLAFFDQRSLDYNLKQLEDLRKQLDYFKRIQAREANSVADPSLNERRFRQAGLPSLADITSTEEKKRSAANAQRVSEAQRYLEQLVKQGDQVRDLTAVQQALADIERGRIDGITPKLKALILEEAKRVDLQRELNELKEREAGFQALLSDKNQRDNNRVLDLLAGTESGQRAAIERDVDLILDFANRVNDPEIFRQASEAMEQLRERLKGLGKEAEAQQDPFAKLADSIEKTMERSTDAVLDFVLEGKGGVKDLGRAFARDVLRTLIEDPVRETMKAAANEIRRTLQQLASDTNSGSGFGGFIASIFRAIFGGGGGDGFTTNNFAGQANGGRVRRGQVRKVGENGPELVEFDGDATVYSNAQSRAMLGGGVTINDNKVINVNGDVSPQTVQLVEAMLARDRANTLRSMRLGGAAAGG